MNGGMCDNVLTSGVGSGFQKRWWDGGSCPGNCSVLNIAHFYACTPRLLSLFTKFGVQQNSGGGTPRNHSGPPLDISLPQKQLGSSC